MHRTTRDVIVWKCLGCFFKAAVLDFLFWNKGSKGNPFYFSIQYVQKGKFDVWGGSSFFRILENLNWYLLYV